MSLTVNKKTSALPLDGGQEGLKQQFFNVAWSTTDTTGTISVQMKKVFFVFITLTATAADSDVPFWADTLLSDGGFTVGADGVITLGRVTETGGSITSGGTMCVHVIGY